MSRVRADNLTNTAGTGAPTFPNGASVVGVITATTFDGNATTATTATTANSLSENATGTNLVLSGNLSAGIITATTFDGNATTAGTATTANSLATNATGDNLTLSGDLTVNGTQTIINTTSLEVSDKTVGIGSTSTPSDSLADGSGIIVYGDTNKTLTYSNTKKAFETNIPIAPNENRFITGAEKITIVDGNTVNLSYNTNSSNIGFCTNPSDNVTLNVTGIPTSSDFDSHAITFTVITNSTGTARTCTAVNLNGVSKSIRWVGGSLGVSLSGVTTTNGQSIFSFTGINTVGSASTTDNYLVLGTVSGGYW